MAYVPVSNRGGTEKKQTYVPISQRTQAKKPSLAFDFESGFKTANSTPMTMTGPDTGDIVKGFAQGLARGWAAPGAGIANIISKGAVPAEFTPQGKVQQAIFGTDKPFSLQTEGDDVLEMLGQERGSLAAPAVSGAFAVLDLVGGGGVRGFLGLSKAMKNVDNVQDAAYLMRNAGFTDEAVINQYAPVFARTKDTKKIDEALIAAEELQKSTQPVSTYKSVADRGGAVAPVVDDIPESLRPLAEEARKYKSAEEFTAPIRERVNTVLKLAGDEVEDIRIVGSVARGKENPNDIDILITPKKGSAMFSRDNIVQSTDLYNRKAANKVLTDELQPLFPGIKVQAFTGIPEASRGDFVPLEDLYTRATKGPTPEATSPQSVEQTLSQRISPSQTQLLEAPGQSPGVPQGASQAKVPPPESSNVSLPETVPQPAKLVEDAKQAPVDNAVYQDNRVKFAKKRMPKVVKKFKDSINSITDGADVLLGPISTRLKNIDPSLKSNLRRYEFNVGKAIQKDRGAVEPFLKKMSKAKMTAGDYADLDLALKNGDKAKTDEILTKYGLTEEYKKVQSTLDGLYTRAKEAGFDVTYRDNYFPRQVEDSSGLLEYFGKGDDWSMIDEAIKAKETDLGRYLDMDEKATLVNTLIRGYGGKITLSGPGNIKGRKIDVVDAELNEFYRDSVDSLLRYIDGMNDAIEARKFFGKSAKDMKYVNVDDSIGKYTLDLLLEGKIKPSQEKELRSMLTARFNQRGTSGAWNTFKNIEYIDTMGSFTSAVTQIGDLAFAIYKGGIPNTVGAFTRAVAGKSKITRKDLGIEKIAQEFQDSSKSAKAVSTVFKAIGLEKMDTLGKETLVNATMSKFQKQAKKGSPELDKTLKAVFGDDTEAIARVTEDLKAGRVTEDTKLLAFNELLDVQPAALSEMPEQYLKGGNGRIFYMLKSYTMKLWDVYRNDVFQQMKTDPVKGITNLVKLTATLAAMNATADEIKDFMLNRKTPFSDRVVDNIAKLAGFSKYTLYKAREEGVGSAVAKTILPPFKLLDSAYKDIVQQREVDELETIQSIPLAGKLYYWWFGKGSTKESSKGEQSNLPELPELPELPPLPELPDLPEPPKF